MIEISEKQVSLIAQDNLVPAYLTIGGIQQEYRVTQIDSSFSSYKGRKFIAELEKVPMSESVLPTKVDTKEPKLKGYKLNPNYTPSAGDYLHIADWDYGEIEELVAMTPYSWWYSYESKLKYGFEGYEILLFSGETFGTATTGEVPWSANHVTKSDILVPVEEVQVYSPENVIAAFKGIPFTCGNTKITEMLPQPKKGKPLKYTELWMADTSNDVMGIMSGWLTHGKLYDVLSSSFFLDSLQFGVVCDKGCTARFSNGWFKSVRLYDEDESELICRDIEFVEGDYIDLRKHTPEQIRHIAKFYPFYDLKHLLRNLKNYPFIYWDEDGEFVGTDDVNEWYRRQDEYTYDDIFYSEEAILAEQCIVCGEGVVTQIEELSGSRHYNCDTCGSDYVTAEQVSYNLSLNKEPPSDA